VADLVGRKVGPYEIRDVIGRGGMATVYRAYQPSLNRYVAIKVLNPVMSQDAEFVNRFRQEAMAAGGLSHPNILRIYDADVFEGRQCIVMALASGGTLAQRLRKRGAIPFDAATDMVAQIADALNHAHRRRIIHRDIKPSNILLDEEDRPLLADFGIAQAASGGPRLTQTGASIGTPDYMSPEQAEGRRVDGRSDLFSLGIVLYQMATSRMPFQADTSMATMFQVVHQTPPPPRSVNPTIPPYLDSIIQKALAKRPEDRFQTGQEMAQALRERRIVPIPPPSEARYEPTQAMRAARPTPSRRPAVAPRDPGRAQGGARPLLVGLLVLTLIALLGGGGYLALTLLRRPPSAIAAQAPVQPTETPIPSPTDTPIPTPTAEAPPKPARSGGGVVVTKPTMFAQATPTQAPAATQTPVIVVITVMAPVPTVAPTLTPVPQKPATATAKPTAVVKPAAAVQPPTAAKPLTEIKATTAPAPTSAAPGIVLNFESFGNWRIGDEKYGSFAASAEQRHGGQTSGKLAYQFPAVTKNYVVFTRVPAAAIAGQPAALSLWVYGDGSGHFLNAWVRDKAGEVRQFTFGQVAHTGWQEMIASLDTTASWPQAHISGPDNGRLDFPITLDSVVLDGVPDGGGPFSGAIYVDDLGTSDVAVSQAPTQPSAAPAATAGPAAPAPPAASAPPAGLAGHIVYTSGAGGATAVWVLDVGNRNTWELRGNARQGDIYGNGRVIFNGSGGGKDNLFSVGLDGSGERMTGLHPEDSYPHWSPTGVSVTFHSSLQGDGKDRIYIQKDTSHSEEPRRLQINKTDVFGRYPTWLESWRIAFTGCNYWASGSNCGIWTANSNDSGNPAQLTDNPADISSDSAGGILLFSSPRTGNWEVYAISQGGGAPQNLTNSPSQDGGATFSPDGRAVAFMSNRDGWGIWVMNADGSGPQKLVSVPGFGANWQEERLAWGP